MTEQQHTPGPRIAKKRNLVKADPHPWAVLDDTGADIAHFTTRADAELDAAGPDLLAALEGLLLARDAFQGKSPQDYHNQLREAESKAKEAVRKARGG